MAIDYEVFISREAKWAEVDLDALAYNMRSIREKTGPDKRICAVIKANAYGHGALICAKVLLENGADQFAVAVMNEALELRSAFHDQDILVLGNLPYGTEMTSVKADLQHTVTSVEKARLLSEAAVELGKTARVHIKVDSGMTRLGFLPDEEGVREVLEIAKLPNLDLEGIFTHFARADESDKYWAEKQYEKYCWFVDRLAEEGITFRLKHVSNSAAIMEMPQTYNDMVRPGIILYGIYPSGEVLPENLDIRPVMTWKTRILHIKTLREDRQISYGGRYTAHKGDVIGTLAVGYADGYSRAQSGKAEVIYKGHKLPVVGNICMDQCMIDLTDFPDARVGDEVILMGSQGDETITADDLAERYGTIGYEVVCAVNRRVPRYYIKDGEVIGRINYLEQH
ncbi:MAG: alanine racemase [Firmicutes bacterium]|nr:alanine racemase [Bacillota bacterium]